MTADERRVISPFADLHEQPDAKARRGKLESQLVYGETFLVEEEKNGWCKGRCAHDGYAGYIESRHLDAAPLAPTHIVTAARTCVYPETSIKTVALSCLSLGSRVAVKKLQGKFAQVENGGWIFAHHLVPVDTREPDHVATALKFLETPYCWGGRSAFGIDCSGLVQVAMARAGIKTERDTGPQMKTLGKAVEGKPQRGDIVYFAKSHVGIMVDGESAVHADGDGPPDGDGKGFEMRVRVESLATLAPRAGGIVGIRRI